MRYFFIAALVLLSAVPAHGQAPSQDTRQVVIQKSPTTALLLGMVVPGAGHIYSGEVRRGASLALISGMGLGVGFGTGDRIGLAYGLTVHVIVLAYSVYDSPKAARRFNEAYGVSIRPSTGPRGSVGVAVSIPL